MIIRYKLTAEIITVDGHDVSANDAGWLGLQLALAQPRVQSTAMLALAGAEEAPIDIHLRTPFCHPDDDQNNKACWVFSRVRPKFEVGQRIDEKTILSVNFELWDEGWVIAYALKSLG